MFMRQFGLEKLFLRNNTKNAVLFSLEMVGPLGFEPSPKWRCHPQYPLFFRSMTALFVLNWFRLVVANVLNLTLLNVDFPKTFLSKSLLNIGKY